MLTVHHLQCSQSERIVWLCEELSVPYDLKLHQRNPVFSPPELAALSPLGAAPVIFDSADDVSAPLTLAESGAVVEYIIHKHGGGRLALPPSHEEYADYLYWFHLSNGNLQPALYRSMQIQALKLEPEHRMQQNTDARLDLLLNMIDSRLTQVPWLAGKEFTAADIMSVFSLSTMRKFYPLALTDYPAIVAWLQRVGQRPAYQVAMKKGDPDMVPCLGAEVPPRFRGLSS